MPEQIYSCILKSGDVLFQEGEEGDNAYIVETLSLIHISEPTRPY